MSQLLIELLESVQVENPQAAGGLQVFGLHWQCPNGLHYQTLDEAMAAKTLDVTEISEGGSVPLLKVANKAQSLVFLMAGEQLIGAKQNRVLNASLMVPEACELPIPVSCVEAGRWRYRSPKFASGGTMSHGSLRKMMTLHASEAYREQGAPLSKQGEIWAEVDRKLACMGSVSPSHALDQAYEDFKDPLASCLETLHVPEGCCGVAFAIRGQVVGADLFDQPATLVRLWPKLVRAFAIDALEEASDPNTPVSPETVRDWLGSARQARLERFKSPGLGDDVRLDAPNLLGACLDVGDRPVHLELFGK